MPKAKMTPTPATRELHLLSQLALGGEGQAAVADLAVSDGQRRIAFLKLAHEHHVVIRSLQPLKTTAAHAGASELAEWAANSLAGEHARIANALEFLDAICRELEV